MTQLEIIKQRLARYTDPGDTDEKLEEGSIVDWVNHSDTDMAWLVGRLETTEARVATLEGALRQVEWDSEWGDCLWCNRNKHNGHTPTCARQAALRGGDQI